MPRTGRRRAVALTAIALTLLAACGEQSGRPGDSDPTAPATREPTGPATLRPPQPSPPGPVPTGHPQVESAVADLAAHLGVPAQEITVVSLEDVTWPDGSLGCPQPGVHYTQALVPGVRLVLEADGVQYPYHGGADGRLVRCQRSPLPPVDNP